MVPQLEGDKETGSWGQREQAERHKTRCRKIETNFGLQIYIYKDSKSNKKKEKWSLWLRKQVVNVGLAKLFAEKRKQPHSGHMLMLFLCDRVIEAKREVTNSWAAKLLQLFRK